jgi:alkylated DNA repair dioxygenase AlkB
LIDAPARSRAAQRIALEGGGLLLFPDAFADAAPHLFAALQEGIDWRRHEVRLFGRRVPAPRLSAWYGEPGCTYRYSGTTHEPAPFTPVLQEIRARLAALCGQAFDGVLLNLYRDGNDAMGWHSDDEPELGPAPLIASVSLGATRRFLLRRRDDHARRHALDLRDGSLLLMEPPLQAFWQHALPRTRRRCGPRINLTWRRLRAATGS